MGMQHLVKAFDSYLRDEKRELNCLKNRDRPSEYLIVKKERGVSRYYLADNRQKQKRYITKKDVETLKTYCRERYYQELENKLPKEIEKLEKIAVLLGKIRDGKAIFDNLPEPVRKYADPQPGREKEMVEEFYRKARETPHNSQAFMDKYKTDKGDYVRSKSEKIIADMLFHEGIPYDYEQGVFLKKGGMRFPDFTILNTRTGIIYRWEHFGGMDEDGYRKKNTKKIADYENSGFVQGINLIMTFEIKEVPLNIEHVRKLMKTFLK